jgi:rubrerythrin
MYNISEVFEIAEQIERNGYSFYQKAADIAVDESAKKFLLDLASMEMDHENLFIEMKKKFTAGEMESPFDGDNIALSYLQAMVDGDVFINIKPSDNLLKGDETVAEIRKLAIEFEKNTVVYFLSLRNALTSEEDKMKIEKLVNEEIQHIAILTNWQV